MLILGDRIIEIVNKWDLSDDQKKLKKEILEEWNTRVEDEVIFNNLMKICEHFTYYSVRLAADSYKKVYKNFQDSIPSFEDFLKESIFMPLRRKERIESSVDMFSNFRLTNGLDASKTFIGKPSFFLTCYEEKFNIIKKRIQEHETHIEKNDKRIEKMQQCLKHSKLDSKTESKIVKKIKSIEDLNNELTNEFLKEVAEFHSSYFKVKNIVFIDDFIGTGTSAIKLIKEVFEIVSRHKINIYLLVLETSVSGRQEIEKIAKKKNINVNIFYLKESIDVLGENIVFPSEDISSITEVMATINKKFSLNESPYCKNHAIASFVNAPNNNLTLLSKESATWRAIFLRTNRNENKEKTDKNHLKDIIKSIKERK